MASDLWMLRFGRQVIHAIKGESLFMVGCDDEPTFLDVKPYLDAMGTTIVRCGGIGMGTRMKVVNNMQILTIAEVTAEAILLSEKLGLKLELVKQVNADTTATNGQMQFTFPTKVFSGDIAPVLPSSWRIRIWLWQCKQQTSLNCSYHRASQPKGYTGA